MQHTQKRDAFHHSLGTNIKRVQCSKYIKPRVFFSVYKSFYLNNPPSLCANLYISILSLKKGKAGKRQMKGQLYGRLIIGREIEWSDKNIRRVVPTFIKAESGLFFFFFFLCSCVVVAAVGSALRGYGAYYISYRTPRCCLLYSVRGRLVNRSGDGSISNSAGKHKHTTHKNRRKCRLFFSWP
jgi:hypothetical protein